MRDDQIKALVKKVEPMLGVTDVQVEPLDFFSCLQGIFGEVPVGSTRTICLNFSAPEDMQILTVIHEMVHLAQHRFDGLKQRTSERLVEWKGQLIRFSWQHYWHYPWEVEARYKSRTIVNYLESIGFLEQLLKEEVNMNQLNDTLKRCKGRDGRIYILVQESPSNRWAVVSEGFSEKVNGWTRWFEAEGLTKESAEELFTSCIG
jgi:hypothetical protein